jgi:hypothetical protein
MEKKIALLNEILEIVKHKCPDGVIKADEIKFWMPKSNNASALRSFFNTIIKDIAIIRAWSSLKEEYELTVKCDKWIDLVTSHQPSQIT